MDKDEVKEIISQLDVGLMEFQAMLDTLVELVKDLKFIQRLDDVDYDG